MIPASTTCRACGCTLDASRNRGRCPACLFATAFGVAEENDVLGTIGGHELIGEIARGGMGVVYRARQREPERIVALKTMRGTELDSPAALVRFRQEAKAMADLEHVAILPVFAFGEHDGIPFFTMKLATGGTLAERLGAYAGKWRETAELVTRVADAVQHAHMRAVLHRDLKPANILFDEYGRAFVSDFGLAKLLDSTDATLTRTAAVMGTPHYLAPEIAARDARAATTASDVWSLGVILYELLAQRRPFDGESIPSLLRAITDTEPAPLLGHPPRDLAVIALKALAREPARRYASAAALAEDLRCWLDGRPIEARPVSLLEKLWLWARRCPRIAALLGMVASLMLGAAGLLWKSHEDLKQSLAKSLMAQASLARTQVQAGTRSEVLRLVRKAVALVPYPTDAQRAEWRTEAVAALALPEVRVTHQFVAYSEHNDGYESFSADFSRYAAAMAGGGFGVLETASGKAVRTFLPPAGQEQEWKHFFAGAFRLSPDGAMVAAAFTFPDRKETLTRVFEVASGTLIREFRGWENAPAWPMWRTKSEEGFLCGQRDGALAWYDARGGQRSVFLSPENSAYRIDDSLLFPNNCTRAVALRTIEPVGVAVWDDTVQRWHLPLSAMPRTLAWSADGRWLALGGVDRTIQLVDAAAGKVTVQLPGHPLPVIALGFSPVGDSLLSLAFNERIVWQSRAEGGFRLSMNAQPRLLQISADGSRIAFAPMKGALAIAELIAPMSGKLWPGSGHHKFGSCIGASADGSVLIVSTPTDLQLWDGATGTLREKLPWPAGFESKWPWFEVEPNGQSVIVAPGPHSAVFNPLWHFPIGPDGHFAPPRAVTDSRPVDGIHGFSPGGRDWIVSGKAADAATAGAIDIALWPRGDRSRGRIVLQNVIAAGMHFCTPDGRFGITASQHHPDAHIWDLTTGKKVRSLGYQIPVTCIVSPDRKTAAIISPDESSLWETATWTKRAAWKTPPGGDGFTPHFSTDSAKLAQLDREGRVSIHLATTGAPWLTLTLPANLSPRECQWLGSSRLIVMGRVGELMEWNLDDLGAAVRAEGVPW